MLIKTQTPGTLPQQPPASSGKRRKRKRGKSANNSQGNWDKFSAKGGKFSPTQMVANAIYGGASHKTKFWFGVAIALFFGYKNAQFYYELLQTPFGVGVFMALLGGIFIMLLTTYIEVAPVIRVKSTRSALESLFLAASKPSKLPTIAHSQSRDPGELYDDYALTEKRNRESDATWRWMVIGIESLFGLIFITSVGTGIQAVGSILMFVMSIFGCEHGLVMAIRAHEMVLPPAVGNQFRKLIRNNDRALDLK